MFFAQRLVVMQGLFTLEARNVGVGVRQRRLLEGVSLTISHSELVGVMGSSGSGKTTLLTVLNGQGWPTAGSVLLNGSDLHANYDQFKGCIGYVPQDDIIHRELTVGEALYFSARLRLPSRHSERAINSRISAVLDQLGLRGTERMPVGSPESMKGISGGERKRVNLAMELLTDPMLLFLDEPTSGLSSGDAFVVMRLLRKLADNGKTIVVTIHQPSLEAFRLMDKVAFLGREPNGPGQVVYYGAAYPDAVNFFNPGGVPGLAPGTDPRPEAIESGYRRGCERHGHDGWVERFRVAADNADRPAPEAVPRRNAGEGKSTVAPTTSRPSALAQWLTLSARTFAVKSKDRWGTLLLFAQAPIVGALIDAVFSARVTGTGASANPLETSSWIAVAIFLLVLSALWFGCSNTVREIVGEAAIYRRERMLGLRVSSYLASKFTVLGSLCIIQCATLLAVVLTGCSLKGAWPGMFFVLLVVALVGVAVGLLLSALAKTSEAAIALVPIILLPMVILGGRLMPVHKMIGIVQVIAATMPSRWGFEAMLLLESDGRPPFPHVRKDAESEAALLTATGDWAEDYFPIDTHRFGVVPAFLVLLVTLLGLAFGAYLALVKRTQRVRGWRGSAHATKAAGHNKKRIQARNLASPARVGNVDGTSQHPQAQPLVATAVAMAVLITGACFFPLIAPTRSRSHRGVAALPASPKKAVVVPRDDVLARPAPPSTHNPSDVPGDRSLLRDAAAAQRPLPQTPEQTPRDDGQPALIPADIGERHPELPAPQSPNAMPVDVLRQAAEKQFAERDFEGAASTFTWLIAIDRQNAYYFGCRARSHLSLGHLQLALVDADEAIRLNPADALSWHVRASIYEEAGDFESAQRHADRAQQLASQGGYDSESMEVLAERRSRLTEKAARCNESFDLGKRYFRAAEYQQAIVAFTRVLQLKPNSLASYHWRAIAYERVGEYSNALRDMDAAIPLNPSDASLLNARAHIHESRHDYVSALDDLDAALELEPTGRQYAAYRARLLQRLRRPRR